MKALSHLTLAFSMTAMLSVSASGQSFYFPPQPGGASCPDSKCPTQTAQPVAPKRTAPPVATPRPNTSPPTTPAPTTAAPAKPALQVDPNELQGKDLEYFQIYQKMTQRPDVVARFPEVFRFLKNKFEQPAAATQPNQVAQETPPTQVDTPPAAAANPPATAEIGQPGSPAVTNSNPPAGAPVANAATPAVVTTPAAEESTPPETPAAANAPVAAPPAGDDAAPPVEENPDIGTDNFPGDLPPEGLSILGNDGASSSDSEGDISILGSE